MRSALNGLVALTVLFQVQIANSQNYLWAKRIGGNLNEIIDVVTNSPDGAVIYGGRFEGTVDLNHDAGTYTVNAATAQDAFIAKTSSTGQFIWAKALRGGTTNETVADVMCDNTGNIYACGVFGGTVDFDPGPATHTINSGAGPGSYLIKLDPYGNFLWVRSFKNNSAGYSLALEASGDIYFSGSFNGTVDFDPGPATNNIVSAGSSIFLTRFDQAGNIIWVQTFAANSGFSGLASSITTDSNGNILMGGQFSGTLDFDPGPGVFNMNSTGGTLSDGYILKLTSAGAFVWAKKIGDGSTDNVKDIYVDANNDIVVIGVFHSIVDFDPGAPVFNLSSAGNSDIFLMKLLSNGTFFSAYRIGDVGSDDVSSLDVDNSGNFYLSGYFHNSPDFDPGPGVYNVPVTSQSLFVLKLDPLMNFTWVKVIGGANPVSICVDTQSDLYVGGVFWGSSDFDPNAGTKNLTSAGNGDGFLLKLGICPPISPAAPITGGYVVCPSSSLTLFTSSVVGATGYSWTVNSGAILNSSQGTTSMICTFASTNATVSVRPINYCSTGSLSSVVVSVMPLPTVGVLALPSTTVLSGSTVTLMGTGANTYSWTGGISDGVPFTINSTTNYTVTGTDSNGCKQTATVRIKVVFLSGLEKEELSQEMAVYPMPCFNELYLRLGEFNAPVKYELYNELGNVVLRGTIEKNEDNIDLEEVPEGTYFLKVNGQSRKVIKLRVF